MNPQKARFRGGSRWARMMLFSISVGILSGLAAQALEHGVQLGVQGVIGRVASSSGDRLFEFRWSVLLLPALGGLITGLVVGLACRPTRAHGTAVLIDAFHHESAEMSLKDSLLKAVAAVAVITFGGSVGKEAPIAVLGAAIGTTVAGAAGMSARERRTYLVAGCAAGVGAIFQCPLGGALFAITVLYREPEIEGDALLPSIIASVTSYSTFMAFGGYGHRLLDGTESLVFRSPFELLAYAGLAIVCAGVSLLFYSTLRISNDLFRRATLPRWLLPSLAGLAGGAIACGLPQIMDARYQVIQGALDGTLLKGHTWIWISLLFIMIILGKAVATSLLMGSNSAGGLFGPVVFMGGATGAATGALFEAFFPGSFPEHLRAALIPVGMAGTLSASLRTPLAAIVMVTEMTGTYGLIVPLMLVSMLSYLMGRRWGVYAEQLGSPEESPGHAGESIVGLLENAKVKDLADLAWPHAVAPSTPLAEIIARFPAGSKPLVVVLDNRRLAGVITPRELVTASAVADAAAVLVAADLMSPAIDVLHVDDDVYGSLEQFRRLRAEALPAVEGEHRFAGVLTRAAILEAIRKGLTKERQHLLQEHAGLATIAHESRLQELFDELAAPLQDAVKRLPVPPEAVGKSLRELDYRRRHGAQVIAIETESEGVLSPPDPGRPLRPHDVLVLLPAAAKLPGPTLA